MWTGFPFVFAAIASTLSIPLTLVSLGIIARGSVFAFRKVSTLVLRQRLFGATFALSSLLTPFFLGTVAGAIASGRVPPGDAGGAARHTHRARGRRDTARAVAVVVVRNVQSAEKAA